MPNNHMPVGKKVACGGRALCHQTPRREALA